jgi:hypothetical protein
MSRERLIPLAACNAGNCPGIWLDPDDGSVVVQGDYLGRVSAEFPDGGPQDMVGLAADPPGTEARVRIPADVLRRAVLAEAEAMLTLLDEGGDGLLNSDLASAVDVLRRAAEALEQR